MAQVGHTLYLRKHLEHHLAGIAGPWREWLRLVGTLNRPSATRTNTRIKLPFPPVGPALSWLFCRCSNTTRAHFSSSLQATTCVNDHEPACPVRTSPAQPSPFRHQTSSISEHCSRCMKRRMLSLFWCGTERAIRCLSHAQSSARQAQMLPPHTTHTTHTSRRPNHQMRSLGAGLPHRQFCSVVLQ